MNPRPLPVRRRQWSSEVGGVASGIVVAVVVLAALVVAGFFYFGGEADVDIKNPDIHISSTETPSD
jgi:hypothetical protein